MINKIIITFQNKLLKFLGEESEKHSFDWEKTVKIIEEHIEHHTIFLKPLNGPHIKYDPNVLRESYPEIEGVSVTYCHEDVEVPETKAPAFYMKQKLEKIIGKEFVVLLNREPESFSGYYVYIN